MSTPRERNERSNRRMPSRPYNAPLRLCTSQSGVVDVQDDGIPHRPSTRQVGDIADAKANAHVVYGVTGKMTEVLVVPARDSGQQFCHDDAGADRQSIEQRPQREAHAESADQHSRPRSTDP